MAIICAKCGAKQGLMASLGVDLTSGHYICPTCQEASQQEARDAAKVERARINQLIQTSKNVLVTSTPSIDGHRIKKYLGIESVEFVIGTGAFSEITSSVADFFGARSSAFEKKLRAAKTSAMDSLKFLAAEQGANAIVGVDLDYTEFTGNRIALIINGTLVQAVPIKQPSD